ncbi:hypothetical protein ACIRQT_15155 [Streptomyces californicus]|uniref:hypothetical protein n=1 Tax=Streptomyces californicus TaxID=67351 RepID=UPI00382399C4
MPTEQVGCVTVTPAEDRRNDHLCNPGGKEADSAMAQKSLYRTYPDGTSLLPGGVISASLPGCVRGR